MNAVFSSCLRFDSVICRSFDYGRPIFVEDAGLYFIDASLPHEPAESPATAPRAASARDGRLPSNGTTLPSRPDAAQLLKRGLHHGGVILAARNRDCQLVQHR